MPAMQAGRWYRDARGVVLDIPSAPNGHEALEGEGPRSPRPPGRSGVRTLTLDEARKELRAQLKDMKALKAWAWPNDPRAVPFVDAFRVAIAKGRSVAPLYVNAVKAHTFSRTVTADSARKDLQAFLDDMDALKQWSDPSTPAWAPFVDAFKAARVKALDAATRYATAIKP